MLSYSRNTTIQYIYKYKQKRKHSQHNIRSSMNERTQFFIKIYLTLYSWKGCKRVDVGCVWEVSWRRGQTVTYWPKVPLNIALLSHLGWAAQPWVTEGPSPLSGTGSHYSILSPTATGTASNWLTKLSVAPGYIIVWCPPASCGYTYLHRIQPCPQVKVIFQYLWLDAPVLSLDWQLSRGSICNNASSY